MSIKFTFTLLVLFETIALNSLSAQWVQANFPGSRYGAVYYLCVRDTELFAGITGGIFRSKDNGAHWQNFNPILPPRETNPSIWSLAVNDQRLYAMLGNGPNIYISSDGEINWIKSVLPTTSYSSPFVTAASGNTIVAGLGGSYRSTDNGTTWSRIGSLSYILGITRRDSIMLAETNNNGISRSTDNGATWNTVYPLGSNLVLGNAIALSGNRAIAGRSIIGGSYLLASSDAGLTWPDSALVNCNSINAIVFSPPQSGNNYVFAATDSGVFRSSDNGLHWTAANNGLTPRLVFSLAVKVNSAGGTTMLFAGTGSGIFVSLDYGNTWSETGSPSSQWTFGSTNSLLVAASSNGLFKGSSRSLNNNYNSYYSTILLSTDNGSNWTQSYSGFLNRKTKINSLAVNRDNSNGLHLVAGGVWGDSVQASGNFSNILSSSDNGSTWSETQVIQAMSGVVLCATGSTFFISSYSSLIPRYLIFLSSDRGNTWTATDTPKAYIKAFSVGENRIFIGGSLEHTGRVSSITHSIQLSTDGGASWAGVASPLDSVKNIKNFSTDTLSLIRSLYSSGVHLFVGMESDNFEKSPLDEPIANGGGLYHLIQNGSNWIFADSSFIGRSVFGFAASGSTIFAATDSGVFRSSTNGTTWSDISSGMNHNYVPSLFTSASYLFASTSYGLWKRPLLEITSVESGAIGNVPTTYSLSQNFPNPFNPSTVISYQLPRVSIVTLKVFDVLGQEVKTLKDGREDAGVHSVTFDARNLSSGVYFYRLHAGDFIETKKLLLLK